MKAHCHTICASSWNETNPNVCLWKAPFPFIYIKFVVPGCSCNETIKDLNQKKKFLFRVNSKTPYSSSCLLHCQAKYLWKHSISTNTDYAIIVVKRGWLYYSMCMIGTFCDYHFTFNACYLKDVSNLALPYLFCFSMTSKWVYEDK